MLMANRLESEREKYRRKFAAFTCGIPEVNAHGNKNTTAKRLRKNPIPSGGMFNATCLVITAITDERKQEPSIHKMLLASGVLTCRYFFKWGCIGNYIYPIQEYMGSIICK